MTEKRKDAIAKKHSILDAAVTAFIELGYERTSMDYVAKVANASKRTVYNHFPSKEILFQEIFNRFLDEIMAEKQIVYDPTRKIEDQLGEFAESKIRIAKDSRRLGLMRVAFGVFISHPELSQRAFEKIDTQENSLENWLKAATLDDQLRVEDPKLAAETFWSMFSGSFFWPAIVRHPIDEKTGAKLKTEFIHTFLARYKV